MFIIDCTYKTPIDQNGQPLVYGEHFNQKKRVRKLLQKCEQNQAYQNKTELSKTPKQIKSENSDTHQHENHK